MRNAPEPLAGVQHAPYAHAKSPASRAAPPPPPPPSFNASAGQSNYGLQSPVPPCHFYADHRYRILYVRTSKTASTSISRTLGMKENPMVCKCVKAVGGVCPSWWHVYECMWCGGGGVSLELCMWVGWN
jgi:hypothetical protein